MNLRKPLTRLWERQLASPVGLKATRLTEAFLQRRARSRELDDSRKDLQGRFCNRPFTTFELHENGNAYLCCPSWLPRSIGNLNQEGADSIWNSEHAQDIRRSVLDGDFKYCSRAKCPVIAANGLPTRAQARKNPRLREIIDERKLTLESRPEVINLANDRSCNLSCPSCRTQRINFTSGRGYELRKKLQDRLAAAFFSQPSEDHFTINVTGSGDPFASRVFREFLLDLDRSKFPNMRVALQTNGTLFNEKNWKRLNKIHGSISTVYVSFDAASEATYKITRRGGNWQHLQKNVKFLSDLRAQGLIEKLRLDFVVQQANYREMVEFVKLSNQLTVDQVFFSKATNWGTWSAAEFRSVCVWEPEHPEYAEFRRIIADPIFQNRNVVLGNLTLDRKQVTQGLRPTTPHGGSKLRYAARIFGLS